LIASVFGIAIGAILGANLRYLVMILLKSQTLPMELPMAIFVCNVSGSLLAGFFLMYSQQHEVSPLLFQSVSIGFLGSLTTFSSFAVDNFILFEKSSLHSLLNIALHVITTWLAVMAGGQLCKRIL